MDHANISGTLHLAYIKYGIAWISMSITLLCFLRFLLGRVEMPKYVEVNAAWQWKNTVLSCFHAFVISIWTLYCIGAYADLREDPIDFINPTSYAMLAFSTGYFLYDFADHIIGKQALKCWEVSLHHVGVILVFVYNLATCRCIGYSAYALLTEVNSVFLHVRRAMKLARIERESAAYRVNAWVNVITCATFRSVAIGAILHGMYALPVRERCGDAYFVLLSLVMAVMVIINPVLFFRLVRTDFLSGPRRNKSPDVNSNVKVE